jgi:YaiO family outer membrane protein
MLWGTAVAAVLVAALAAPTAPRAQATDEEPWAASVRYERDRLSGGRADWQRWTASVQRRLGPGTLMASLVRQRRFGRVDEALVLQAWRDLWTGAYAHVRAGVGPSARIRPQRALEGDVHQAFGPWVASARYGWRRYRGDAVHAFGPGLARYAGAWYLYTRTTAVPRPGTWALAQRVGARRFFGPADTYVEATVGVGRSVEIVGPDAALQAGRTAFASLRLQYFPADHLGISASAGYSDAAFFERAGASLGLTARW